MYTLDLSINLPHITIYITMLHLLTVFKKNYNWIMATHFKSENNGYLVY